jgi:hypothetical protein
MKKPGGLDGVQTAGLDARRGGSKLDHTQHDRADKGECGIGGKDAQSADDSHGNASLVNVAAL